MKEKPRIKTHGFIEWLVYHSENDTLAYNIFRLIMSCSVAFITAFIVAHSNTCGEISDNQGAEDIQEYNLQNIE